MSRRGVVLVALAAVLGAVPAGAAQTTKHSGTISRIDPAKKTLTLQEMGPWTGSGTGLSERIMAFQSGTKIERVQRSRNAVDGGWRGGYVESPLPMSQLRPGDFATVTIAPGGRTATAVAIDVVGPPQSRGSKG